MSFLQLKSNNKFICIGLCFILSFLISCKNYERSTEAGQLLNVDMTTINQKIENDETFVMAFTQSFCHHCETFKQEVLLEYLETHEVYFHEVVVDKQEDMMDIYAFIEKNPNPEQFITSNETPTTLLTPTFYFIIEGEVKETWVGTLDEESLDKFVVKYKLDAK